MKYAILTVLAASTFNVSAIPLKQATLGQTKAFCAAILFWQEAHRPSDGVIKVKECLSNPPLIVDVPGPTYMTAREDIFYPDHPEKIDSADFKVRISADRLHILAETTHRELIP